MIAHTADPTCTANGVAKPAADDVFVFPTTVRQQGFWYLDQLQPGNPAYNIAVRFRLQGVLRAEELEHALNEIVRRHESLRTVFAAVEGVPVQVVMPRFFIPLERDDLREASEKQRRERAERLTAEEGRRSFDLATGPLIRARLLRLADEEHVLVVTVHHIVSDGWSIGIFLSELGTLYDAYCRGETSPLPDLALQYPDFAVWQKEWLQSNGLEDQLKYWTRQLSHLPVLEIPPDRPRPPVPTSRGSIESILLPKELTDRLASLSHREKATPFMTMLAVFQVLLQRCSGRDDVFVGSVLAGRARVELEPLIGLFINPVVLRTDLSGDPSFLELLARVRQTVLQAFANQDIPFERVVDAVQPKRDPSRHPLFQINFLYQRDFVHPFQGAGLTITAIPSLSPGAIYDLNFFMVERAEGWRASCEYNTDVYEASTIRRLLGQFQVLLEEVAANPAGRISEFPLTSRTTRELPEPTVPLAAQSAAEAPLPAERTRRAYVAPRDPVECKLAELWERVLGVDEISVTADFFDMGGHSLLAAQLLAQVTKTFGRKVPLAVLLQSPTIASFAARLRAERVNGFSDHAHGNGTAGGTIGEEKWEHPEGQVFPLRGGGSRPPLLLVDAGPFHRPLVRRLGNDQPVLGVALPELSALPNGFTVGDIASNLLAALDEAQVGGPYCLAGWSQAGVIAYEMARQLRARGQDVALLILFDTNNPDYLRSFKGWHNAPLRLYLWLEKVLYHLRKVRRMPWRQAWQYFRERMRKFALAPVGVQKRPRTPGDASLATSFVDTWQVQYLAANDYEPHPCDWPIVLVRSAALQTGWFRDPQLGWGRVARAGLRVFEMPGEHDAMFLEPDVRELAAILQQCLRQAMTAKEVHAPEAVLVP